MKEELLKGLTKEQIVKVKACKNTEEILKVAAEEGVELTEEQLEAVSGGSSCFDTTCPKCGSSYIDHIEWLNSDNVYWKKKLCKICDYSWDEHPR